MKKHNVARARELRRTNTEAEALLWRYLRNRAVGGFKFARQEPIGSYIADFVCRQQKLVIELDGEHNNSQKVRDAARTAVFESLGYRVIRFSNADVLRNIEGVVSSIGSVLVAWPPHPNPLPQGERGPDSRP